MNTTDVLLSNPSTRKIVFFFVENLPKRVGSIRLDLESESRIELRNHAHELKGTAASFGFMDISDLASELETQAESSSYESLEKYLRKMELLSIEVCSSFENRIH